MSATLGWSEVQTSSTIFDQGWDFWGFILWHSAVCWPLLLLVMMLNCVYLHTYRTWIECGGGGGYGRVLSNLPSQKKYGWLLHSVPFIGIQFLLFCVKTTHLSVFVSVLVHHQIKRMHIRSTFVHCPEQNVSCISWCSSKNIITMSWMNAFKLKGV